MSLKLMKQVFTLALPLNEKAFLIFCADYASDDGTRIFPGLQTMLEFTHLTESQTYRLLRKLKERGYLVQVNLGGGQRHFSGYRIPLDAQGNIKPQPPAPESLPTRRRRKVDQALATVEASPSIPETPAPECEVGNLPDYSDGYTPRHLPAVKIEELTIDQLIGIAEEKVASCEALHKETGGRISARMLAQAKQELLALQQQQGGYQ